MKCSGFLSIFLMVIAAGTQLAAQTKPVLGPLAPDTIYLATGAYFLVVPGVDDGDAAVSQDIAITAVSSNAAILKIDSTRYTAGSKTAIIYATENDVAGSVDVMVTATDADGATSGVMKVEVVPFNNPGIRFEIHDAVFWQEVFSLKNAPVYSKTLPNASITAAELDFTKIKITVNQDCTQRPPCTGSDFYTQFFKGYLVVPATGSYTFYTNAQDGTGLWLSADDKMETAKKIIYSGSKTKIGVNTADNEWKSEPQTLTAGKIYAMYATHWVIHTHAMSISWEGPGIPKTVIPGTSTMPTYSPGKPGTPLNFAVLTRGGDFIRMGWNKASAAANPAAYNVYANGIKELTLTDTIGVITGLTANTTYSLFVTSVDVMGKESFPSEILTTSTHIADATAPSPPTQISDVTISDLAVKIRWSGAKDNETAITSYNVYVNDVLYNNNYAIYDDSIIIKNLTPKTAYQIEVAAIDAGKNVSAKSAPHTVTTIAFDAMAPELGVKKAAVNFTAKSLAEGYGFGINTDWGNGLQYSGNIKALTDDLKPALYRWGALPANPCSFSAYSGAGKADTYAKFLKYCNDNKAFCAITTGISESTDWRTNPQTFANFIEYLNGPATSTFGARRAAEGIAEPLMANSRGLMIELGCEVWGASAHNADIGADYAVYAKWCRDVTKIMKSSPYFDSTKMFIQYSGRNPAPTESYGLHDKLFLGDSGIVDMLTVAGYLGGNMNYDPAIAPGKSEAEYYKDGFMRFYRNINGLKQTQEIALRTTGEYKPTFFYETNMTTPSYNGRLGQAVTIVDYMATAMEWGSVLPAIFHLYGGEWKIVRTEENNKKLPLYVGARLYNRFCKGSIIANRMTTRGYLVTAAKQKYALEPVGVHMYNTSDTFSVLLSSRDFDNDYHVQLNFENTIASNTQGTLYTITGSDFSTVDALLDSVTTPVINGMLVKVPKHSILLLTFKSTGLNLPKKNFGHYEPGRTAGVGVIKEFHRIVPGAANLPKGPVMYKIFDLRGRYINTCTASELRRLPKGMIVYKSVAQEKFTRKKIVVE